ncbi:MAG: TOBE domain-containing protein, partial [Halolamina sp.]
ANLVIRPEKLHIDDDDLDTANVVSGAIEESVFRGTSTRYDVRLDSIDAEVSVESQNLTRNPPYQIGDEVVVGWEPESALLYER